MIERVKVILWKLLPGVIVTVIVCGGWFAIRHRNDHALLHALIVREEARIRAAQVEQQQLRALQGPPRPTATTPETPNPIGLGQSPVPAK